MKVPLIVKEKQGSASGGRSNRHFVIGMMIIVILLCFASNQSRRVNVEASVSQGGPSSQTSSELNKPKPAVDLDPLAVPFDSFHIEGSPERKGPPQQKSLPSPLGKDAILPSFQVPGAEFISGGQSEASSALTSRSDSEDGTQARRPERFNRKGKALLLSPIVVSMKEAMTWDPNKLPLPPKENPITEPKSLIPWGTLSEFRPPQKGGKNLFVAWLGPAPPPIIHAFVQSMYRNKGGFTFHLITNDNLEKYMTLKVGGKQICPDLHTRLPENTHISLHVWSRIWSAPVSEIPLATRKDFVVNVLVTMFGGVFMDPGLLGFGKLDYWWDEIMQKEQIDYINYSFGEEFDIAAGDAGAQHLSLAVDPQGRGKWSGQLWIDVFFTMVKADAPIMQAYLHYVSQDHEWGPSRTQVNNSPYFIYGGDVLDACFNSVYDWLERKPYKNNRMGVIQYRPLAEGTPPGSGYNSDDEFSNVFDELDESLPSKDMSDLVSLFDELDRAFSRAPPPEGHKDPPAGFNLKESNILQTGEYAIMFNMRAKDNRFSATQIPQSQYSYLGHPLYPDFETMILTGHPGALNARAGIDTLVAPEGGIYLKFYGTGEELKNLTWEKLCGPPESLIIFMIQSITGENICTAESFSISVPSEKWQSAPQGSSTSTRDSSRSESSRKSENEQLERAKESLHPSSETQEN